jgi:glycosyltransferase involved in cell wall biosynthesis
MSSVICSHVDKEVDQVFRFLPYQERGLLRLSLGVADVHLMSLRPELEGLIVPSKLYGIAAAGRPIIAIAAPDGEIAGLVRRHDCGAVIEPGEGEHLAAMLRLLRANPGRVAEMGHRARALLDARFTRRQAFGRWRSLVEEMPHACHLVQGPTH